MARIAYIGTYHCIPITVMYWSDIIDIDTLSESDWIRELLNTNFYL